MTINGIYGYENGHRDHNFFVFLLLPGRELWHRNFYGILLLRETGSEIARRNRTVGLRYDLRVPFLSYSVALVMLWPPGNAARFVFTVLRLTRIY